MRCDTKRWCSWPSACSGASGRTLLCTSGRLFLSGRASTCAQRAVRQISTGLCTTTVLKRATLYLAPGICPRTARNLIGTAHCVTAVQLYICTAWGEDRAAGLSLLYLSRVFSQLQNTLTPTHATFHPYRVQYESGPIYTQIFTQKSDAYTP